ncbi:nuclear transport factor 2 family protein [Spirosoma gilvum]
METIKQESIAELTRKGACLAFFEAYSDLDTARMINLATPDATVHFIPLGEDGKGTFWEFGKTVWQLIMDCFPNVDNTVDAITADGDVITCQVTIFGTQANEFMGIPSKGHTFNSDHVFVFRFDPSDRITHVDINWDSARFVSQLS